MANLNFPSTPSDGDIFYDNATGNRYVYDATNTVWKAAANATLSGTSNKEILYNSVGGIAGNPNFVYDTGKVGIGRADPGYELDVVGSVNASAVYVNGGPVTGGDPSPANAWANLVGTAGNNYTNYVGLSSNNYAASLTPDVAAANAWANTVGTAGNNYTNYVGLSSNNYAASLTPSLTPANNWANTVGTAGNNYSVAIGTAGNSVISIGDVAGNNWSGLLAGYSNTYAAAVGAAANSTAATAALAGNNRGTTAETAGNNWSSLLASYANSYASIVGAAANARGTTAETAGNNWTNAQVVTYSGYSNNYATAVGAAANARGTTAETAGNNWTNAQVVTYAGYANSYASIVGTAGNNYGGVTYSTWPRSNLVYGRANAAFDKANTGAAGPTGPTGPKGITILAPIAADEFTILYSNVALTLKEIRTVVRGTGSPTVNASFYYGTSRASATIIKNIVTTSTTSGDTTLTFDNNAMAGNSFVWLYVNLVSGTVNEFHASILFT